LKKENAVLDKTITVLLKFNLKAIFMIDMLYSICYNRKDVSTKQKLFALGILLFLGVTFTIGLQL